MQLAMNYEKDKQVFLHNKNQRIAVRTLLHGYLEMCSRVKMPKQQHRDLLSNSMDLASPHTQTWFVFCTLLNNSKNVFNVLLFQHFLFKPGKTAHFIILCYLDEASTCSVVLQLVNLSSYE